MTSHSLPPEYADLTPFLEWALPTADQRYNHRRNASRADLKAFYDAMIPRIEAILSLTDEYPLGQLPETLRPLYYLALSLAEVAPHIELYGGATGVPYAFEETRMIAVHGNQDTALGLAPTPA